MLDFRSLAYGEVEEALLGEDLKAESMNWDARGSAPPLSTLCLVLAKIRCGNVLT